jgi:hypothetical protein
VRSPPEHLDDEDQNASFRSCHLSMNRPPNTPGSWSGPSRFDGASQPMSHTFASAPRASSSRVRHSRIRFRRRQEGPCHGPALLSRVDTRRSARRAAKGGRGQATEGRAPTSGGIALCGLPPALDLDGRCSSKSSTLETSDVRLRRPMLRRAELAPHASGAAAARVARGRS